MSEYTGVDRRKNIGDRRKNKRDRRKTSNEKLLLSGILRLNARVLGLALGLLMGLGLFIATNWLVIKGGHRTDSPRSADLARLPDGRELWLEAERVRSGRDHGTGCVFSAAIAAGLALGEECIVALERAKQFVTGALVHAPAVGGAGPSPVDPLWRLLPR